MADFINTVDVIGDEALMDSIIDRSITEFHDETATTVGEYAFYNCNSLVSVMLPNVETVSTYAFADCTALETVDLSNTTAIAAEAFRSCAALKTVKLPSLTVIKTRLFFNCTSLTSLKFPSVLEINTGGNGAFQGCSGLKTIDFSSAAVFYMYAFYQAKALTALILRSSSMCTLKSASADTVGNPIASGTGYIYVPRALIEDYKTATNWSTFADQFRALEDYTVDGTTTGDLDETKI